MARLTRLCIILLLLLWPNAAFAQEPEPLPEPDISFPAWDDIPDAIGYVTFTVPQCTSPHGNQLQIERLQPSVTWTDIGSVMAWVAWQFENSMVSLTCWLYAGIQHIANIFAWGANALIMALNALWKSLVMGLLTLRALALWAWYGFEWARGQGWSFEDFVNAVLGFFVFLGEAIVALFSFIGQFLLFVGRSIAAIVGMIGYVLGIVGGMLITVLDATRGVASPAPQGQLQATELSLATPAPLLTTSPVFCAVRGALDGIHQSAIGWMMYLLYAFAYVVFIYWVARYFSEGKEG